MVRNVVLLLPNNLTLLFSLSTSSFDWNESCFVRVVAFRFAAVEPIELLGWANERYIGSLFAFILEDLRTAATSAAIRFRHLNLFTKENKFEYVCVFFLVDKN